MTEPYVRATRYIVNLIPESIGVYAQLFEITVERRGLTHRWAVVRHDQYLSSNGVWDDAPRASEREDGWLDEHRFDLATALRLANEAAPHVTVKGRTAAEALARLIATGRIAPSTLRRMADEAQRVTDALAVIHEWQHSGDSPNDYLTRVHKALNPPVSGNSVYVGGEQP